MFKYKGYSLPRDLLLLTAALFDTIYYSCLIKTSKPADILLTSRSIEAPSARQLTGPEELELKKTYRAANYFLLRFLGSKRPCLCRSLVLEKWCRKRNIAAQVIIGVKKSGTMLESHAWLEIENQPFNENMVQLKEYTTILRKGKPDDQ